MMEIQAAVCWDNGSELDVTSVSIQDVKDTEVLVRVTACAVSPLDLYIINNQSEHSLTPFIPGHESVGEVIKVGKEVRSLNIGDTVIPLVIPQCNRCAACLSDKTNMCTALHDSQSKGVMPDQTSRLSCQNKSVKTCMGISGFATHIVVPEISLAKIPSGLPAEELAVLCHSVISGLGAVFGEADLQGGESIAVFGAGPVGLGVIQAARLRQVSNIIVIEPSEIKRNLAKQLGAVHTIDPNEVGEHLVATICELSQGGVEFSFECSGSNAATLFAVASTNRNWGKTLLLSSSSSQAALNLDLSLMTSGRQIKGLSNGGIQGRSEMADYVQLYKEGHVVVKPFISKTATLHEVNECLAETRNGDVVRSVITF